MEFEEIKVRGYNKEMDRNGVEDLERSCEVGPNKHAFLYTDTMGDPICRIRNSPLYNMLVAELQNEIVGVIQGTIKVVTMPKCPTNQAKVGYILGLRISPFHRRKGIGSILVQCMEDWFVKNKVDYAHMATEKDNVASVKLFIDKLGYMRFRTPAILIHPVSDNSLLHIPDNIEIVKLKVDQAEHLYRKYMHAFEFFPCDIDKILANKLSLGTWMAYFRGESYAQNERPPKNWAMLSAWNSGDIFKLRVGEVPFPCFLYTKWSRFMKNIFPCCKVQVMPDFFEPFGFYFMYGVYHEGPSYGKLVRGLCNFVHNIAMETKDCKVIVTEVLGGGKKLKSYIPHWKLLSYQEDLWCIKALKDEEDKVPLHELVKISPTRRALFVDPREV